MNFDVHFFSAEKGPFSKLTVDARYFSELTFDAHCFSALKSANLRCVMPYFSALKVSIFFIRDIFLALMSGLISSLNEVS